MVRYSATTTICKNEEGLEYESTLQGLMPANYRLEINNSARMLNLLRISSPSILAQQQFTKNEWRILITLLTYRPHYAPYEALLASLTSLSPQKCLESLQAAQQQGAQALKRELKPVHRALSGIRVKLNRLSPSLKISLIRNLGYSLTTSQQWETVE